MGTGNFRRTEVRDVNGIIFDQRPEGLKMRMHRITVRVTNDEKGKSISLEDELRGIIIEIPLEPVEDLMKWVVM